MTNIGSNLTPTHLRAKWLSLIALVLVAFGAIGIDQLSKVQAQKAQMVYANSNDIGLYQGRRHVLAHFGEDRPQPGAKPVFLAFAVNYVRNQGAAWGALSTMPRSVREPFFYVVTIVALIVLGLYLRATPLGHRLARFALALIIAGALGNFVDRLRLGYVIDWIDVRWNFYGWRYNFPNFNVADSAITVGVILLFIDMLILDAMRKKRRNRKPASPEAAPV